MASLTKKSWKIQEFAAHSANVTCLALGHKSGRVLVTGGDDRKVNLWAVGKPTCIMSLSGHSTPVTSVKFNHTEELVVAGAQAGALKVWDLEAARLVRTLTGHRSSIRCSDFHPYGDFLTSGSQDTSIKLWDTRRKGCIFTYKGHQMAVNSLNFSPDGQWIASGGDDGFVKVWDLRMGRVLKEFSDHSSPVTSVEFHPHEFLLASGSLDRTVNFWDLESFQLVSTEKEAGAVRCLAFNPGGECLYAGSTDTLRVLAWEPSRILDVLAVGWSRVNDIAIAQNQLIGASFHMANIMLYVVEIKKMQPFDVSRAVEPFARSSVRRSFLREGSVELSPKTAPQVKTIEESTSGTDQDEDASADIPNINDYREVFKPNRSLVRTPPPTPFLEPVEDEIIDPTLPQIITSQSDSEYLSLNSLEIQGSSLPHQSHSLELETQSESRTSPHLAAAFHTNRSVSNLENVFNTRSKKTEPVSIRHHRQQISECIDNSPESEPVRPPSQRAKSPASAANSPPQRYIRRQVSCKEDETFQVVSSGLKHSVSEVNVNRTVRSNSFSRNTRPKDLPVKLNSNRASVNPPRVPSSGRPLDKPVAVRPTSVSISDSTPRNVSSRTIDNAVKNLKNSISSLSEPVDFIPMSVDKPVGLDLDDFLPKSHRLIQNNRSTMTQISEEEALESLTKGHAPMMAVLESRVRSLNLVYSVWHNKGVKSALEGALAMNDLAILVDVLSVMVLKTSLWNLGICVIMLPKVQELLQSKYETYVQTGCNALQLILQSFGQVISNTVRAGPGSALGVDITREERHSKCTKCHSSLVNIRAVLLKRQTVQGPLGSALRDLHTRVTQTLESST